LILQQGYFLGRLIALKKTVNNFKYLRCKTPNVALYLH